MSVEAVFKLKAKVYNLQNYGSCFYLCIFIMSVYSLAIPSLLTSGFMLVLTQLSGMPHRSDRCMHIHYSIADVIRTAKVDY